MSDAVACLHSGTVFQGTVLKPWRMPCLLLAVYMIRIWVDGLCFLGLMQGLGRAKEGSDTYSGHIYATSHTQDKVNRMAAVAADGKNNCVRSM
jgi:hypothetical protein